MNIRPLRADEIEARVQIVKKTGCSILLYKDARCDMRILDEVVGPGNWTRSHEVINGNLFCNVSIWDKEKKQWVTKQDVGTESYTEKEKGQASDSFKRACFNWGIGRELYTAPFIWINLSTDDFKDEKIKTRFSVSRIDYNENKEINFIEIKDDKHRIRYTSRKEPSEPVKNSKKISKQKVEAIKVLAKTKKTGIEEMERYYGMKIEDMTEEVYLDAVKVLNMKK